MATSLNDQELRHARDLGAATYLTAYVRLMARELGIETEAFDQKQINAMALDMVEATNMATEAAWCALMKDRQGVDSALKRLSIHLKQRARN